MLSSSVWCPAHGLVSPTQDIKRCVKCGISEHYPYSPDQVRRANGACRSCINLINNRVLDEAVMRRIAIIAGGYIGGQTREWGGVIRTNSSFLSEYQEKYSAFLASRIDPQFPRCLHISSPPADSLAPVIINPLLGMDYSEQMVDRDDPPAWVGAPAGHRRVFAQLPVGGDPPASADRRHGPVHGPSSLQYDQGARGVPRCTLPAGLVGSA